MILENKKNRWRRYHVLEASMRLLSYTQLLMPNNADLHESPEKKIEKTKIVDSGAHFAVKQDIQRERERETVLCTLQMAFVFSTTLERS